MSEAPPGSPPRFLAVVGATASGKTALGVALALRLGGEVVSMDSRQVYRGMDVGTAKPSPEERRGVPHHGFDLIDPDRTYSAGRFARDARGWIAEVRARGRVPILVGGTGFFLRALTTPIFREPALDPERRRALRARLGRVGREELARWVAALDPARAAVALAGGPQRLERTLEVALLTGRPLSWWHRHAPADADALPALVVALELSRPLLDRRIDARVDDMLAGGLVDEVRALLERGYGPDAPGMTGVGYREVAAHLGGALTLEEAAARMRAATRAYARRQATWFRNQLPADALRLDAAAPLEERVETVARAWERSAGPPRTGDAQGAET